MLGRPENAARSDLEQQPLTVTYAEALDDARTLSISPEIEELLGYTQVEWMADPLLGMRILHPDDRDRVMEECTAANQEGKPFRSEYRMIGRDGRIVRIRDHAVLVRGSRGQPLCWRGTMVEVLGD